MRQLIFVGVIVAAFGFIAEAQNARPTARPAASTVTFAKDVAPIFHSQCITCHRPGEVAPMSLRTFDEVRPWLGANEGKHLFGSKGCEECNMEGYAGRSGVFEVMPITRTIRNLISDGEPARTIRTKAVEEGMLEFRQSALLKVARGETSTEEVFRVVPAEHLMMED